MESPSGARGLPLRGFAWSFRPPAARASRRPRGAGAILSKESVQKNHNELDAPRQLEWRATSHRIKDREKNPAAVAKNSPCREMRGVRRLQ